MGATGRGGGEMKKQVLWIAVFCFLVSTTIAQNFGDQATAGFDNSRTYANDAAPSLKPPLRLFDTIELSGAEEASSLAVFDNHYLVGKADGPISYRLYDAAGILSWTATFQGNSTGLDYIPAHAQGIVILGGDNTSSIRALRVTDGSTLWTANVGTTAGRYPVITDNLAIYAGASQVTAVDATTGQVFWQVNATTAAAPVSVFSNRVYFLEGNGVLRALDLRTGAVIWGTQVPTPGAVSVIPTENYVFVAAPDGTVNWLSTQTGLPIFPAQVEVPGDFSASNALAFSHGRLIVFRSDNDEGDAAVSAFDPKSGALIWEISEPGEGLRFGFIANDAVYYYHEETGRIRVRDLATGTLLWSITRADVAGLTVAGDALLVLSGDSVEIYRHSPEAYLAQMASGMGQRTLLVLSNTGTQDSSATIEFFDNAGEPFAVPVQGVGSVNQLVAMVTASSSKLVQINPVSSGVVTGWVRVTANQPMTATSVYQFLADDEVTHEASVGDSSASGAGNVLVTIDQAGFNTGIAIANPTDDEATVTLTLLDAQGQELGSETFTVPPLGHVAQFVNEWFDVTVPTTGAFEGTVVFNSDVPVTVTALRTKDLLQMSSYPVGQAVK